MFEVLGGRSRPRGQEDRGASVGWGFNNETGVRLAEIEGLCFGHFRGSAGGFGVRLCIYIGFGKCVISKFGSCDLKQRFFLNLGNKNSVRFLLIVEIEIIFSLHW